MSEVGSVSIAQYASDEFIEKKSRFIGHIAPIANEEEAFSFVEKIREQHRNATHNCYAWIAGENDCYQRSSDAGEPAGTAGRPILEALKREDLHDVVLVVTRYFGGILLGAGGLTRAYAKAAQLAIAAADKIRRVVAGQYALTFDYALLGKVESCLRAANICVQNKLYAQEVCFILAVQEPDLSSLAQQLADLSAGAIHMQDLGEKIVLQQPVE